MQRCRSHQFISMDNREDENKMIYFTSDMHLGHKNIIEYSNRPFKHVDEMDYEIIKRFNSVVKPTDTVYDLGDTFFRHTDEYLRAFCCPLIRIKGSHDHGIDAPYMRIITALADNGNAVKIILCHYAMRSWEASHYGSWHLFGHHHGKLEPYGLSFDVGVDSWNFYPVSINQVAEKMATLKPIVDFRKEK